MTNLLLSYHDVLCRQSRQSSAARLFQLYTYCVYGYLHRFLYINDGKSLEFESDKLSRIKKVN